MPELPEVETTRRGISPHVVGRHIERVDIRERRLRWPVPDNIENLLTGQRLDSIERRAKYLLLHTQTGSAIVHLGMSGRLQVTDPQHRIRKHDHVDIVFDNNLALRFHDPRRFGCLLWSDNPARHPLLVNLGPEPLSDAFDATHLYQASRGRRVAIKSFIMDAKIVVGVGNIYASEALFLAGIHPLRQAGKLSRVKMARLTGTIKQVLAKAIEAGGTTLRDYLGGDGNPGYFAQQLNTYGRTGEPCTNCGKAITQRVIGQRSTFYCTNCQS